MGLRLDGVENVSSVGMDRNYTEPRRPRSREHSRRSSYEKNHRVSGEKGLNGSRPVPVETPLSVIIAKNDNFENGHYSIPKMGFNHCLDADFTKKTLDLVHGHSSATTPASSLVNCGPSTSSLQNASFSSPQRLAGRHEEVQKRRNIVEKIEKLKADNKCETFISQMDSSTSNQLSLSVRRYARLDNPNLPEKMKNFILEGTADSPMLPTKGKNNVHLNKNKKCEEEGDGTDYDDLDGKNGAMGGESIPSSSKAQWLMDRAEFIVMDTKIGDSLDATVEDMRRLTRQLEEMEAFDQVEMDRMIERRSEEEQGCARLIPWDNTKRRKLKKMEGYVLNSLPSTSKEIAALNPPTVLNHAERYLHRVSIMSSYHVRKNKNKSIWYNSRELEEEKFRNGVKKKEDRERREKRKMERAEKEEEESDKSDEYEVTDDDDDEMPTTNYSKKLNGAPKEKKRKKDSERKASRRENNKNRRPSDCPVAGVPSRLSSVASRPSFDGDMDYLTPSFNHSTWLEHFKKENGTNFTYNKIPVPECRRVEIEDVEIDENEDLEEYTTDRMMERLAAQHHVLEHEERLRFTINPRGQRSSRVQRGLSREQREASQESGRSRSTPSNRDASEEGEAGGGGGETAPSIPPPVPAPIQSRGRGSIPVRPPIPPFNYDSIRPVTDYQRLSIEPPYEKRKWDL